MVRQLEGVFHRRPALPRNTVIWDTSVVLGFLQQMDDAQDLLLKDPLLKLVTLIASVTGHRAQTLQPLDIRNRSKTSTVHKYRIGDIVKQTRPGTHQAETESVANPKDKGSVW